MKQAEKRKEEHTQEKEWNDIGGKGKEETSSRASFTLTEDP